MSRRDCLRLVIYREREHCSQIVSFFCQVEKSLEMAQGLEEDGTDKGTVVPRPVEKEGDMKQVNGNEKLSFPKDFKELESRLSIMDAKLREVSHKYFFDLD